MRTKFYIAENKWFISEYILKDKFPMPDNLNREFLEKRVNEIGYSTRLDMYYYIDESILPLQFGDKVVMGTFDWRITDKVFNYNSNSLIYTLTRIGGV